MKKTEKRIGFYFTVILFILVMYSIRCSIKSKNIKLELILDSYIEHYKISKSENYLLIGSHEWSDTSSILVISFNYILKDKLNLPKESFKSSFKGISIYSNKLTIPNALTFEKIMTNQAGIIVNNTELNDIQIIYRNKDGCILYVLNETNKDIKEIVKSFKQKELKCN